jgi:hypothetical protein
MCVCVATRAFFVVEATSSIFILMLLSSLFILMKRDETERKKD